jgi:thymidylate kinase
MEKYLHQLGFKQLNKKDEGLKLFVINNADGSPRWIWNAKNPHPDFLRFYAVSGILTYSICLVIKAIFKLHLQRLLFGHAAIKVSLNTSHVLSPYLSGHFAVFTGTTGPNRKLVLFAANQFFKIALNEASEELIENEKAVLEKLGNTSILEIPYPTSVDVGILALTDLGRAGKRNPLFSRLHAKALNELYSQIRISRTCFNQSKIFKLSQESLAAITAESIPTFIIEKLKTLAITAGNHRLLNTWSHLDFTPWNCYVKDEKIMLYDFELAKEDIPFGFDAIHFTIQQGILVDHLPWNSIKPKVKSAFDLLCEETGHFPGPFDHYLHAYLLINISYYLKIYSAQEEWHTQVQWLLTTWNDALSDVLSPQMDKRALLTCDIFDFLHSKPYAALKLPEIHPSNLSELSDLDLLLDRRSAKNLAQYLKNHSQVAHIKAINQSHMLTLMVTLLDGRVLYLDLIWQLKRKSLVYMDCAEAIKNFNFNSYGIKTLNRSYTSQFLTFFYGLNGSKIPSKYHHYFEGEDPQDFNDLEQKIKNIPENSGWSGLAHRWNYLTDVLRRFVQEKGIIITFSGVDGAGKSTIIEHTRLIVEKKLRKKVVIIRHRPSLLPILSALTMGKEMAEKKVCAQLPRQGDNKSLISSLLRFTYYYTDYLFGQIYVYLKYVMWGHVVLYDRYYFDFIIDSLRSNIRLPRWMTQLGYMFIMTPNLNFFLYADPSTILKRKKELDQETISKLTDDYLGLFRQLGKRKADAYHPIENINLEMTLRIISSKTQSLLS